MSDSNASRVTPFALRDAPTLIERVFPVQKVSAEAQTERKAGAGQTLTSLGSYWKGRKPLVLVRACVLGSLLPATEDPEEDLAIFEMLMAMDDDAFQRRVKRQSAWPSVLQMPYLTRVRDTLRPEELPNTAYDRIWPRVNKHLGTDADSFETLVYQLGIMRFGRRPRVADVFAGGGSIPFEAARLGADAFASDLNPMACLLTWGAGNIIGGSEDRRTRYAEAASAVVSLVEKVLSDERYEVDAAGNRVKALLYCLEVICPQTGWRVPLATSWVVSFRTRTVAVLTPDKAKKSFEIEIISDATADQMKLASRGTFRDGQLEYDLDGETWSTPIKTIRGDHRVAGGGTNNRLRKWANEDVVPRTGDIFTERLYCIQWIDGREVGRARPRTWYAAPRAEDLAQEDRIIRMVQTNLLSWQEQGLVPAASIEPGDKTDELIRTRGWTMWHHVYHPRHLLIGALLRKEILRQPKDVQPALCVGFARALNFMTRLTQWRPREVPEKRHSGGAPADTVNHVFYNQAFNTFYNYAQRGFLGIGPAIQLKEDVSRISGSLSVVAREAQDFNTDVDLLLTDPPYADAVVYDELSEYFVAWFKRAPPIDEWVWDSRRSLAIRGDGEPFRQGMVAAYSATVRHMAENGVHIVMFTHQSGEVWADMAQIFWAAGLRVMAAWYIATETTSELKKGGYVQGTVILVLRKRLADEAGYKDEIVQEVKAEVARQIETMIGLNQSLRGHGRMENLFEDADLQMAGYAAALRVLTGYARIDGRDMTREALRPREKGDENLVGDIIDFAVQVANEHLVPDGMPPRVWDRLTGSERFYLKMMDIERTGAKKLDNYQNFAKAFRAEGYSALMGSLKPNNARLKNAIGFGKAEFGTTEFGRSITRAALYALYELLNEKDGDEVLSHLRDMVDGRASDGGPGPLELNAPDLKTYDRRRDDLIAIAGYIALKRQGGDEPEARAARILRDLIRNERIGT